MLIPPEFKFVDRIEESHADAVAIQRLTLQDAFSKGFEKPREIANPDDDQMVGTQRDKLHRHPERYSGYYHNGQLVAFMKQNEWRVDDELPFATWQEALKLLVRKARRLDLSMGQWGIFGLVVSDEFGYELRSALLIDLLKRSFKYPVTGKARIVNIALSEKDPVLSIAKSQGFVVIGKPGEAAGAPGLKQQRYQRLAFG